MPATWTELAGVPSGGNCASNQVLYHLGSRGIEWQLLPQCQKAKIMVMAYSPLGQGPLLRKPPLKKIADKHGCDPAAVALAWVLRQPGVIDDPQGHQPRPRARQRQGPRHHARRATTSPPSTPPSRPPKRATSLDMT